MTATVALICNTSLHVQRARTNLISALMSRGAKVVLISPYDEAVDDLRARGVIHEHVDISQYGTNPIQEISTFFAFRSKLRKHRPVACLCYTIKANTIGALAAQSLRIPVVNNIAGTGRAFEGTRLLRRLFYKSLYTVSLRRSARVFFQNNDDLRFFRDNGMVNERLALRIPGSGVDLKRFKRSVDVPVSPTFLFIGRLLVSKGAQMYIDAAHQMVSEGTRVKFLLAGERLDESGYVKAEALKAFEGEKNCTYFGQVPPNQVRRLLASCTFLVLPSFYGEGVPRTLLEAGAVGRPIIATESVGCRDVIRPGKNGFKIPPRDFDALLGAMRDAARMDRDTLLGLGMNSRSIVEKEFDEKIVIQAYLDVCSRFWRFESRKQATV